MRARPCVFDSGLVSDTNARRHVSTSNASTGTSRSAAMAARAASGASRRPAAATVITGSPMTAHGAVREGLEPVAGRLAPRHHPAGRLDGPDVLLGVGEAVTRHAVSLG